jgi:hypothetical protein
MDIDFSFKNSHMSIVVFLETLNILFLGSDKSYFAGKF